MISLLGARVGKQKIFKKSPQRSKCGPYRVCERLTLIVLTPHCEENNKTPIVVSFPLLVYSLFLGHVAGVSLYIQRRGPMNTVLQLSHSWNSICNATARQILVLHRHGQIGILFPIKKYVRTTLQQQHTHKHTPTYPLDTHTYQHS